MTPRPLSPHLQIYKPQISWVPSILHRATGFALSVGSLFLVAWLFAAAYNEDYYIWWQYAASHVLGKIVLIGWTFAFYYHLCNGIRYLFWDIGKGFELPAMRRSGWLAVIGSIVLTAATWAIVAQKIGA